MASIIRTVILSADADDVWRRLADFGGPQEANFPGVVASTEFDGAVRTVTFVDGFSVKERVIGLTTEARRIAYGSIEGRSEHHNASFQVFDDSTGQGCRVVWTTDILPDALAPMVTANMERGLKALASVFDPSKPS